MAQGHDNQPWKWMGDGSLRAQDAEAGLGHVVPVAVYTKVFAALIVGTIVTVWAATQDFGIVNLEIAIAIATIKATLVGMYFMHLRYETPLIKAAALLPLAALAILFLATVGDEMVKDIPQPMAVIQVAE